MPVLIRETYELVDLDGETEEQGWIDGRLRDYGDLG